MERGARFVGGLDGIGPAKSQGSRPSPGSKNFVTEVLPRPVRRTGAAPLREDRIGHPGRRTEPGGRKAETIQSRPKKSPGQPENGQGAFGPPRIARREVPDIETRRQTLHEERDITQPERAKHAMTDGVDADEAQVVLGAEEAHLHALHPLGSRSSMDLRFVAIVEVRVPPMKINGDIGKCGEDRGRAGRIALRCIKIDVATGPKPGAWILARHRPAFPGNGLNSGLAHSPHDPCQPHLVPISGERIPSVGILQAHHALLVGEVLARHSKAEGGGPVPEHQVAEVTIDRNGLRLPFGAPRAGQRAREPLPSVARAFQHAPAAPTVGGRKSEVAPITSPWFGTSRTRPGDRAAERSAERACASRGTLRACGRAACRPCAAS